MAVLATIRAAGISAVVVLSAVCNVAASPLTVISGTTVTPVTGDYPTQTTRPLAAQVTQISELRRDVQALVTVSSTYVLSVWSSTTAVAAIFNCTYPVYQTAGAGVSAVLAADGDPPGLRTATGATGVPSDHQLWVAATSGAATPAAPTPSAVATAAPAASTGVDSTTTVWVVSSVTQPGIMTNTQYMCATTVEYVLTVAVTTTLSYNVTTYEKTELPVSTTICPGVGGFPDEFYDSGTVPAYVDAMPTDAPAAAAAAAIPNGPRPAGATGAASAAAAAAAAITASAPQQHAPIQGQSSGLAGGVGGTNELLEVASDVSAALTTLILSTYNLTSTVYQPNTVNQAGTMTMVQWSCSSLPFDVTSTYPVVYTIWPATRTSYQYYYCRQTAAAPGGGFGGGAGAGGGAPVGPPTPRPALPTSRPAVPSRPGPTRPTGSRIPQEGSAGPAAEGSVLDVSVQQQQQQPQQQPEATPSATGGSLSASNSSSSLSSSSSAAAAVPATTSAGGATTSTTTTSYSFHRTTYVPLSTTVTASVATTTQVYICYGGIGFGGGGFGGVGAGPGGGFGGVGAGAGPSSSFRGAGPSAGPGGGGGVGAGVGPTHPGIGV